MLWDSWETEAVVAEKTTGHYADLGRIHSLNHRGRQFRVAGALNVERPPQGYPLLVQAGSSEDGRSFAARHAEAIFTAHPTYESGVSFYDDIKARTATAGRDPDELIVLPGIVPYIGSTEGEARALAQQFDDLRVPAYGLRLLAEAFETEPSAFELDAPLTDFVLARPKLEGSQSRSDLIIDLAVREKLTARQLISRLGGGRGHIEVVGMPEHVADTITKWFEGGAADGFNLRPPPCPRHWRTSSSMWCRSCGAKGCSARNTRARPSGSTTGSPYRPTSSTGLVAVPIRWAFRPHDVEGPR